MLLNTEETKEFLFWEDERSDRSSGAQLRWARRLELARMTLWWRKAVSGAGWEKEDSGCMWRCVYDGGVAVKGRAGTNEKRRGRDAGMHVGEEAK